MPPSHPSCLNTKQSLLSSQLQSYIVGAVSGVWRPNVDLTLSYWVISGRQHTTTTTTTTSTEQMALLTLNGLHTTTGYKILDTVYWMWIVDSG